MKGKPIEDFVRRLRVELGEGSEEARLVSEIEDHLADAAQDAMARGTSADEAWDRALGRVGSVAEIVASARAESAPGPAWPDPRLLGVRAARFTVREVKMIKVSVLALALVTSALAALVGFHGVLFDDGSPIWNLLKVSASIAVIGVGALTWSQLGIRSPNPVRALFGGALFLITAGSAGAVWTWHLARVTGDFEAWALLANLLILSQGCLTAWHSYSRFAEQRS